MSEAKATKIVVCVDDYPMRYRVLSNTLSAIGIIAVTTCRVEDVEEYLQSNNEIAGFCLDHDMPFQSGMFFANMLREYSIPVVITSLNPSGAKNISDHLEEYGTKNIILPCTTKDWEKIAINFWNL